MGDAIVLTIPQAWCPISPYHYHTIGVVPHQPIQVQMLTNAVLDNFTCIDHVTVLIARIVSRAAVLARVVPSSFVEWIAPHGVVFIG